MYTYILRQRQKKTQLVRRNLKDGQRAGEKGLICEMLINVQRQIVSIYLTVYNYTDDDLNFPIVAHGCSLLKQNYFCHLLTVTFEP